MSDVSVIGAIELQKQLDRIGKQMSEKMVKKALKDSIGIVVDAVKAAAPKNTGTLASSITYKIVNYPQSRVMVAIVGADKGVVGSDKKGKPIKPNKYFHLLEFGHVLKKGNKEIGFVPPHPFLRMAWMSAKSSFESSLASSMSKQTGKF